MIVSTTHGYNFEHRFLNPHGRLLHLIRTQEMANTRRCLGHQNSGEMSNSTETAILEGGDSDRCIAVETMKELGCGSGSKVSHQHDPFTSVCERHQLCYTCVSNRLTNTSKVRLCVQGSALGIRSWTCNQMANLQMFELCSDSSLSPSSRYTCLKQRFVVMKLFGDHVYRSMADHPELTFECSQTCVLNYLYSQLKWHSSLWNAYVFLLWKWWVDVRILCTDWLVFTLYVRVTKRKEKGNEQFNSHIVEHKRRRTSLRTEHSLDERTKRRTKEQWFSKIWNDSREAEEQISIRKRSEREKIYICMCIWHNNEHGDIHLGRITWLPPWPQV